MGNAAEYDVISSLSYALFESEELEYLTGIYCFDELLELVAIDCHRPGADLLRRQWGPKGATCKECAFFDGNTKGRCRIVFDLTGLKGKPFSSAAYACKHFEPKNPLEHRPHIIRSIKWLDGTIKP